MKPAVAALAALLCLLTPAFGAATSDDARVLQAQIEHIKDGVVRMQFAARPGVFGDGTSIMFTRDRERVTDRDCCSQCMSGPVRVQLRMRRGRVEQLDLRVGGKNRPPTSDVTDLGEVAPAAAAEYLLDLAVHSQADVGEEAVSAASCAADVVLWPHLILLARNRSLYSEVRKKAIFWLGQAAGDAIRDTLVSVSDDDDEEIEVRKAAVFALSQQPRGQSIPVLLRIARSNTHPEVRRSAFFWLAQYDDPEVVRFFEHILVDK